MSTPTPEDRAGWIAGMRQLLDILDADPSLPLPELAPRHPLTFYVGAHLTFSPPATMAALEAAIPVEFTVRMDDLLPGDQHYYELHGTLQGAKIRIRATARDVAEERVTGQVTTDITEWVRLPVEPEAGDDSPEATS